MTLRSVCKQGKTMNDKAISRRNVIAGASALGVTMAGGVQMAEAKAIPKNDLEIANETLVNNFCRDWSLRDMDKLLPYLAEDLLYQITPGQPLITSREQFAKQMGAWLGSLESVEWIIHRSYVVGPLVLNDRTDHFNAPADSKSPSMHFKIAGHFLVEDGVIKVWKDWPIPGEKQIIG
jgi:limonene-1,2-epoxide hydrolase